MGFLWHSTERGTLSEGHLILLRPCAVCVGGLATHMNSDLVFAVTMPTLRQLAERCRRLALVARSDAIRDHLLALARDMERRAGANDRASAAETDRRAG
jgi:hypothetical protein